MKYKNGRYIEVPEYAKYSKHKSHYSVNRITVALNNEDIEVYHKKIQRIIHKYNLKGIHPKEKYYSYKDKVRKVTNFRQV